MSKKSRKKPCKIKVRFSNARDTYFIVVGGCILFYNTRDFDAVIDEDEGDY